MADYFAWSRIEVTPAGKKDEPAARKFINVGDKVSKTQLPDGQFDELISEGVLRSKPYPEMGARLNQQSPVVFLQEEARRIAEGTEEQVVAANEAALDAGTTAQQPSA